MRLINGRAFTPKDWKDKGLPIIRIQNLNNDQSAFNYYPGPIEDRHRIESGDLLFAWSGTTGTSFGARIWNGPTGVLNQHIFKVVPDQQKLTIIYAFLALQEIQEHIEKQSHGFKASFVHVKKSDLVSLPLPIPSTFAEQTAIANALSDADALNQSLTRLIAKKRQIKQGAMQTLLNPYKNGRLKEGWMVRKLGEVVDIDPENLGANTNSSYEFKYISLEDVDRGVLRNYSVQIFCSAPSRARRVVKEGDVLVGTVRPNLQSHCLIKQDDNNLVCSTGFAVVRCKAGITYAKYIFALFFAGFVEKQIQALLSGSNYPAINSADVRKLYVPLPKINEQTHIATILSDMDAEIEALETKLTKYQKIKQGMMQKLLTGKIRLLNCEERKHAVA